MGDRGDESRLGGNFCLGERGFGLGRGSSGDGRGQRCEHLLLVDLAFGGLRPAAPGRCVLGCGQRCLDLVGAAGQRFVQGLHRPAR